MKTSLANPSTALRWNILMSKLKALCCFLCLWTFTSNVWSMSHWSENRGVNDDFCYQRQAHLFQKYGFGGFDTDVSRDDEQYLSAKMKAANLPDWKNPVRPPCHVLMPATKKLAIQYPPGTGMVMALFPEGFQLIPLYVSAMIAILGFGLLAIACATTTLEILLTAMFADLALYMMINPTKASYSMAPTMAVCALVGYLTARVFVKTPQRHRLLLTASIGFLIGIGVNFRLPNLLLAAGYFLYFGLSFLRTRKFDAIMHGGVLGLALLAGMTPTLFAYAINAGSPLATTYGAGDMPPPRFVTHILWAYATDFQFFLLVLAGGWLVLIWRQYKEGGIGSVAVVVTGNLLVNVAFLLSHSNFQKYYAVPIAMLSLWTLLFASLMRPAKPEEIPLLGNPRVNAGDLPA